MAARLKLNNDFKIIFSWLVGLGLGLVYKYSTHM